MASLNFNAANVAPDAGTAPIPAGPYTVMAVESEIKATQSGGQMAVFTLQVIEGQFSGRKVWARINVANPSAHAEQIGQAQLSALCHACGVLHLSDTVQLHGKPFRARVTIRPADGKYGESNEVKGFEAIAAGAAVPSAPARAAAPAAAAPAPAAAAPPWQKRAA